jgi:ribonuclease VapC
VTEPVLDASAVLAFLQGDPGHEEVARVLAAGCAPICAVNLSEVAAMLMHGGMPPMLAEATLRTLDLEAHPFDEPLALACARLRELTRSASFSLGDRARY